MKEKMKEIKTGKLIQENTQILKEKSDNPKIENLRAILEMGILRILGPCALQNENQALALLDAIAGHADLMRLPVLKPRTNRVDLEGNVGYTGIGLEKGKRVYEKINSLGTGVGIATEIMSGDHLRALSGEIELAWVGSRTQDQYLLESIGIAAVETQTPLMIKNAMVNDAEFDIGRIHNLILGINKASKSLNLPPVPVMLCVRGIHPGNTQTDYRNIPNWDLIDQIKEAYPDLPIIIDPSHILKKEKGQETLDPQAILGLLIDAFNRPTHLQPNGYMIEINHIDHPSITDPGVEVQAIIELLTQTDLLNQQSERK